MASTIRTNLSAISAYETLGRTQSGLSDTLGLISTGLRLTQTADDAAGMGVATRLAARRTSLEQAMRNANDGISMVQTAEWSTNQVSSLLTRMRELAVQSSGETMSDADRAYIDDDFGQLRDEIQRLASVTEFGGTVLGDGSTNEVTMLVGENGNETSGIAISFGDLRGTTLGVDGVSVGTSGDAEGAIDAIDEALATVSGYRAGYGAVQKRLEGSLVNSATYLTGLRASQSQIMDVDFAKESTEMAKLQIMQQAGVAALAQAKNVNQSALRLL